MLGSESQSLGPRTWLTSASSGLRKVCVLKEAWRSAAHAPHVGPAHEPPVRPHRYSEQEENHWTSVKLFVYIADNAVCTDWTRVEAQKVGDRTWMLVSSSGQCQPKKYLKKNRETAPAILARIRDVDQNGPPPNQELFRWLDEHKHRGLRLCEYKIHHPRACRGYGVYTNRGYVIVRIEDKTLNDQQFNDTMKSVKASIDEFLGDGEKYVED